MLSLSIADGAELRPLEPWQADEFAEHVKASRDHLAQFLSWVDTVAEPEGALGMLQRYADSLARGEGRIFGVWVDGRLSGGVLFRVWEKDTGMCELGVWLAPEMTGRGLITKACRLMTDWAFRVRGMHRIEWRCVAGNEPSAAVARRLGMTLDGTLREYYPHNGERHDVQVWSLLAREWCSPQAMGVSS